jgi:hypothetical protein
VTLRARWVTLRARWVTLTSRRVMLTSRWGTFSDDTAAAAAAETQALISRAGLLRSLALLETKEREVNPRTPGVTQCR